MSALVLPRLLAEHNGSLSVEISRFEPMVAAGGDLLPTPTTLLSEGRASGPNYPYQTFSTTVEAVLDSQLRVIHEEHTLQNSQKDEKTRVIERTWDGSDYEEIAHSDGQSQEGYRRTEDDGSLRIMYNGLLYRVNKHVREDGTQLWTAIVDSGFISSVSEFDTVGRVVRDTIGDATKKKPAITTYAYDESGRLVHEVRPGSVYYGDSETPVDHKTTYEAESAQLVVVKSLPFSDSPDNPERVEKRKYGISGEYQGSEIVDGFPDIGTITMEQAVEYKLSATT